MSYNPANRRVLALQPSPNTNSQYVEQQPLPSFVLSALPGRNFTNDPALAPALEQVVPGQAGLRSLNYPGPRAPSLEQQNRAYKCSQCAWSFEHRLQRKSHEEKVHGTINEEDVEWEAQKAEKREEKAQESEDKKAAKLGRVAAARQRLEAKGRITCRSGLCLRKFHDQGGRTNHERHHCKYRRIGGN